MADPVFQSPKTPHFFQPLLTGFHSHFNIPKKFFSLHRKQIEGKTVELRSDSSEKTWKVKTEGRRLTVGWKEFAAAHDYRTNDIIVFRYQGDLMFHVTGFGLSCCELLYAQDSMKNMSMEKNLKKEAEFSSDISCFVAQVTDSNLKEDKRLLPTKFIRSDGLKKGRNKIILTDEGGRTWTLRLNFKESCNTFYMSVGWRSFCHENGLKPGDSIIFRLHGSNKRAPVLRFSAAESKHFSETRSSSSLNENRFVKLNVTLASLKYRRLDLPQRFTRANKLAKAAGNTIILLDKHRVEWPVNLLIYKQNGRMFLGDGINDFFKAVGVKEYESFIMELVWKYRTTLPMLKFCSKNKI